MTMDSNPLGKRGESLEAAFFQKRDQELLEKLRQREGIRSTLDEHGPEGADLADALDGIQMEPEHLVALSLVPLVAVAWADGTVEDKERKAVLDAARNAGIGADSPAAGVLESWLRHQPDESVITAWEGYIHGLKERLGPETSNRLKQLTMGRARNVAAAAGGVLGIGSVSTQEEEMLKRLDAAFDRA